MQIHIIVHNKSNPVEVYLDSDTAEKRYMELRYEQYGYGLITLDVKDALEEK